MESKKNVQAGFRLQSFCYICYHEYKMWFGIDNWKTSFSFGLCAHLSVYLSINP